MNAELTGALTPAWVLFLLYLVAPATCGVALGLRWRGVFFPGERLLLGLTFGLALATALTFLMSFATGFDVLIVWLVVLLMAITAAYLLKSPRGTFNSSHGQKFSPSRKRWSKVDAYGLAVFFGAFALFTLLAPRLILWQNGGLATGYLDAWGDLPLHLSIVMSFMNGGRPALHSTIFAGEPLTYPFLSDFFSAMLMQIGIPLEHAIELPAILLNSVTLTLLFYLGYRLVRHRGAAALAPLLFVLAGGLGFLWFLADLYFAPRPIWEFLQHLPRRYTNISELKIHWVNPVLAHLLPQRSFLFGFPLGLSVILLWWNQSNRQRPSQAWIAGLMAGMTPLFHTHTFITVMLLAAMLALISLRRRETRRENLRYWLIFGATALLVAAPQLAFLLSSKLSLGGIRFHPGWMAEGENWLWFWLKNTSLFIPLTLLALALAKKLQLRRRALWFYLPFGTLLAIGNLFLFSAFAYDTNKVLVFWLLLSLPLVARLLTALYAAKSWWLHGFAFRLLLVALIFSGSLNLLLEWQGGGWPELSAEEVQLAQELRTKTDGRAMFLTAPMHNNLLTLAGRAVVLGYPGHVHSHGLDPAPVEKAIGEIYAGEAAAEAHLRHYAIDYIVAGPNERQRFGEKINWLQQRFPVFAQSENYVIYQVTGNEQLTVSEQLTQHE